MPTLTAYEGMRLADRLIDGPALPLGGAADVPVNATKVEIDDATAAYVADMRGSFEGLRQAEAQLAGLMVLAAASGLAIAGHPMLDLASDAVRDGGVGILSIMGPPRARHHHVHV